MINIKHSEILKVIAQLEADVIQTGIIFLFVENNTIKWKVASKKFDMDIFKEGSNLQESATALKAMREGKVVTEKVPREKYGRRLVITSIPLFDDSNNAVAALSIVLPKLHPVSESFKDFAPIVAELFPEGAFLYGSDLKRIIHVQDSQKFTLPNVYIGYELKETDIAYKTIQFGKPQSSEIEAERYGVPVYISNHPIYDEDTGENVIGTLGIAVPKSASNKLKSMSGNLSNSLSSISETVEHLSSTATKIHENEQNLYNNIHSVSEILDKINDVTEFISSVANQSNMLGLNASIEASRAGEMGRGFSVVANEIRKLSSQSKETVPKIKILIEEIKNKISEIDEKSKQSLSASEEQAASTEEISASIQELSAMTHELHNISKDM